MGHDRKSPLEVAVDALERILRCNRGEEPDAEPTHSRIDRYAEEALVRLRPVVAERIAKRARPHPIMQGPDRPCPDADEPPKTPPAA